MTRPTYSIYIVDDDMPLAKGLAKGLENQYRTASFSSAENALDAIKNDPPDLVVLDIVMPGMGGIDTLNRIKTLYPEIVVIMVTGLDDVDIVVKAMKTGACDYLVKPIKMDILEKKLQHALESIRLQKEIRALQDKFLKENIPFYIGKSKEMRDVMQIVRNAAASSDTPILIIGETGTGKELLAGAVHYTSPNFKGPLISLNCSAIPNELIESELFGYEKGAFSGAASQGKKGLIDEAENGTLFLDEIGDLSLEGQAKLLRFLESGEFYSVGGLKKKSVRTRIVAATNKNIDEMIQQGKFREDLYFRISVVRIEVPALKERHDDILLIANYFLLEFVKKFGKKMVGFSPDAERALKAHQWKGNVRELRNVVERAVLLGRNAEISSEDIGLTPDNPCRCQNPSDRYEKQKSVLPSEGVDLPSVLLSLEKEYIQSALNIAGGNELESARLLNLKYTTFRYRRKKLLNNHR